MKAFCKRMIHIWSTYATVYGVTLNDAFTNAWTSWSIISLMLKSDIRITNQYWKVIMQIKIYNLK